MPRCVSLWVQLLWDSLGFLDFLEVISFARLGKFSFIICSNKFSISCCCSPSGIPIIRILEHFRLPQRFVKLSSRFWVLFLHFVLDGCLFLSFVPLWVLVFFLSLLVPWIFCFISLWVSFIYSFILQPSSVSSVSILITRALNSPSDRLALSLLSSLSGVLFCSFIWAIFLCLSAPVKL